MYLKHLRKLLKQDPQAVVSKLQTLCDVLHRPENFRTVVVADIAKLPNPVSAWQNLTKDLPSPKTLEPLDDLESTISDVGKNPGTAAYITLISI